MPELEVRHEHAVGEEMTRMYRWFNDVGYHVDIEALRREYPAIKSLEQFLCDEDWIRAETPVTAGSCG